MWKWIALSSLLALVIQAGYPSKPTANAKDQLPDISAPQRVADAAMERIKEGDLRGAMMALHTTVSHKVSPETVAAQADSVSAQWKKQRELGIETFGAPLGEVEFVGRQVVGHSIVAFDYLEKFENKPLAWRLTFYRSNDCWVTAGVDWTHDIRPLLRADSAELANAR